MKVLYNLTQKLILLAFLGRSRRGAAPAQKAEIKERK